MPIVAYASEPKEYPAQPLLGTPDAVAEMRAFLARSRPSSTAEALRLLRHAFPEAPLAMRVAACGLSEP